MLILSGDHIYKMDYGAMLAYHKAKGAACTISVLEVPMEDASRFGIMNVDEEDNIYEFQEKPKQPKSNLASMGIYIFTWSKLRDYLIADEANPDSSNDFGHDIIPAMLGAGEKMAAYRFKGYWKDVGTINSLWDANMDMLSERHAASTPTIPAGPSTPGPQRSPLTSPAPTPRSPTPWSPAAARCTARLRTRCSSTPSPWSPAPPCATPS